MSDTCEPLWNTNQPGRVACLTHGSAFIMGTWRDPANEPCPFAFAAGSPRSEPDPSAPPATWPTTEPTPSVAPPGAPLIGTAFDPTNASTVPLADAGYVTGRSEPAVGPTTYRNSEEPSKPSTLHWSSPKNARQFAAQANRVATMVLNGEIELDTARLYASVARMVAQGLSIEVSRARFLTERPDLRLDLEEEDHAT